MTFEGELADILPSDLPRRDAVIAGCATHLAMIVEANRLFNLTRIVSPREAAIKHVWDSIAPWRLFSQAKHVLDAGTGAGFPGIPLALVLPDTRFTLCESIGKKSRFVATVVESLALPNVSALARRAEEVLREQKGIDLITARAVAPLSRAVQLFGPAISTGARVLLYKGPDAAAEIAEAAEEAKRRQVKMRVLARHELPDSLGSRTIVEMSR
ncbi:MAG TPA: 16S rRNA (guanine(527)-N(7))-methyltransferase RsmG [Bryobacteraceae bacterium]|nr:16S rRNA (guanine(527)-N(7))-methyltransferase RsmG [Bryobacteraceae bacterium]